MKQILTTTSVFIFPQNETQKLGSLPGTPGIINETDGLEPWPGLVGSLFLTVRLCCHSYSCAADGVSAAEYQLYMHYVCTLHLCLEWVTEKQNYFSYINKLAMTLLNST